LCDITPSGGFGSVGDRPVAPATHEIGEKNYVLVSDRNFGLYIHRAGDWC